MGDPDQMLKHSKLQKRQRAVKLTGTRWECCGIKTDKDSGYIQILEPTELQETRNKPQWTLAHHPLINPNKPGKVRLKKRNF